jgi:Arc-like DNA binding domain
MGGRSEMPPKSKRVLPGKRYPLNMRTTRELREKIERAALASGRSLVQEVEFRLEQSFRDEYMAEVAAKATVKYLEEKEVAKELTSKKIEEDKS